jgi:FkbM family methyltransferase
MLGGIRVPVLSGVNRRQWWSLISAGSGYGSGRRASAQMQLLSALIRPGDVVWDVGAHIGFVTLAASRRAGATGAVHAFEPSAQNRKLLSRHVGWNGLSNVVVHGFALSDSNGEARFGGTGTSKMYALGGGTEVVQTRTGASLVADGICAPPTFMKIDVEGAEADTLTGTMSVLPRNARLFIAMHDRRADERCTSLLEGAGFTLVASKELQECRRGEWHSDPDLFCIGPDASDKAGDIARLKSADF